MQRSTISTLLAVTAFSLIPVTNAQTPGTGSADNVGKALPPHVLDAISKATDVQKLYPVNPGEKFAGTVLKADEIVFAPGASLTLTNLNTPFIVIVAKRWKFADSSILTKVQLDPTAKALSGTDGGAGNNGSNGQGEVNRNGNPGNPGGGGGSGSDGESRNVPHIYFVAGDMTTPKGEPLPGFLRLAVIANGTDGGAGGGGGKGGTAGNGARGKEGADSLVDCKEGPGVGGMGGIASQGGQGGKGGSGANGSDITFIGTKQVTELFSYARIFNDGGFGGRPGRPGTTGTPGNGGGAAPSNGCPPRQNRCRLNRNAVGGADEGLQWHDTDKHSRIER